jgi:hypothetical protein
MQSANSLLNANTSGVIQNYDAGEVLQNPNIPVKGATRNYEKFKTNSHNVNLKDKYYQQMLIGDNVKNGGTYTLGSNSKGLNYFRDFDRSIDPNMIRRRNKNNNKLTTANSYASGSYGAYYRIPTVTKPVTKLDLGSDPLLTRLNKMYGYKAKFSGGSVASSTSDTKPIETDNAGYAEPEPVDNRSPFNPSKILDNILGKHTPNRDVKPQHNVNQLSGIGTDPTEDPEYIREKAKLLDEREQTLLNRNSRMNQQSDKLRDKYGNPIIRTGTRRGLIPVRRPLNINPL